MGDLVQDHPAVAVPRQAAALPRLPPRADGRIAEREQVSLGAVPGHRDDCGSHPRVPDDIRDDGKD
eukprot:5712774-Heterocapsa_arctica.AAC.1